jgi:flagellar biosynthetic protein FliO
MVTDDRVFGVRVSSQKKRIVVLCVLLVGGGGWVALASRYAGKPDGTDGQTVSTGTSFLGDPNQLAGTNVSLGGRELFVKMMLSVGLVIALGVGALYLSKRVLPKVTNAAGKEIRVLETTYLGPRKALHLVEVANQRLLIASTSDHITTLAHIGDAWLDLPRQEIDDAVKT